jgi:tight adherence protein B
LNFIFANDFIFISVFSVLVSFITYLNADKTIDVLRRRSLESRDEIIRLLELMFVEVEKPKLTRLLLLVSFGLGFAFFLLLWPQFWMGLIIGGIVTVVMWKVPLIVVKNMYENRCSLLVTQMVDGLTIMSNGVKAGLGVTQSMERVVENMSNPISQEFALVLSQIRLGRSVEEALIEFGERIPRPDVQMFVTAINILKETGGNLAETFSTIVVVIRERQKVEKKIEAMTAQGMMQGLIVSFIPFLLIALFYFVDRDTIMPLFTHPIGLVVLMMIIGLVVIGGVVVRKVVKIDI